MWRAIVEKKSYPTTPVLQFSLVGNLIKRWENVEEAAKNFKIKPENILKNINGQTKTSNGCLWEWE